MDPVNEGLTGPLADAMRALDARAAERAAHISPERVAAAVVERLRREGAVEPQRVWWLRPAALIAYVSMLLATPLMGGHYFVDVIAGIGAATLAIGASKRLSPVAAATCTRTSFIGMSV